MASKLDLRLLVGIGLSCAQAHACTATYDEVACAAIGCVSGFQLLTTIALPVDVVQKAQIKICRNRECRSGKFTVDRGPGKDGLPLPERTMARVKASSDSGPGAGHIFVDAWPSRDPATQYLGISWHWDFETTPDAHNDVFDISIEADDTTLYETHRVVEKYAVGRLGSEGSSCAQTCGLASSVDCPNLPERVTPQSVGVVKTSDAPATCPPVDDRDADAGI